MASQSPQNHLSSFEVLLSTVYLLGKQAYRSYRYHLDSSRPLTTSPLFALTPKNLGHNRDKSPLLGLFTGAKTRFNADFAGGRVLICMTSPLTKVLVYATDVAAICLQ